MSNAPTNSPAITLCDVSTADKTLNCLTSNESSKLGRLLKMPKSITFPDLPKLSNCTSVISSPNGSNFNFAQTCDLKGANSYNFENKIKVTTSNQERGSLGKSCGYNMFIRDNKLTLNAKNCDLKSVQDYANKKITL
jgi:hypothetical protein